MLLCAAKHGIATAHRGTLCTHDFLVTLDIGLSAYHHSPHSVRLARLYPRPARAWHAFLFTAAHPLLTADAAPRKTSVCLSLVCACLLAHAPSSC
jgi:hypothetical protein